LNCQHGEALFWSSATWQSTELAYFMKQFYFRLPVHASAFFLKGEEMKFAFFMLALLASLSMAAERVVLFEDFTNCGCGPCWSYETQVNSFINTNLPSGRLCAIRPHVSWPAGNDPIYLANKTDQNVRKAQYAVNSVPCYLIDGIIEASPATFQSSYDQRLAVPAIIAIDVARNGDAVSGSLSFRIIAEEDPQWTASMMLWPIIVEDNIPGVGYWSSSAFEQAFRDNVCGYYGEELVFDGPYPDTIFVDADYTIPSTWDVNELHLATFVQCDYHSDSLEVENCNWSKFLDIETGIGDAGWNNSDNLLLSVGPNPSNGSFSVAASIPENTGATVEVFNVAGRLVSSGHVSEMQNITVDESGIYLVRLSTTDGVSVTESVAVIR